MTHMTCMTVEFTIDIMFSLVGLRINSHWQDMTGIAEITCITGMTVVFTRNILFSLVQQEIVYIRQV